MSERLDIAGLQPPGVTEKFALRMKEDLMTYWDADGGLHPHRIEKVDCSLCKAPCPEEIYFTRERFPYRRCPQCGLVYPSPRPAGAFIREQYVSGRFASVFQEMYLPSAPYRMKTIFKERVEEIIAPRVPRGRLLDVGCGSGHFLKVAFDHGYEVHGVEPNPDMVQYATRKLRLPNIRCGSLPQAEWEEGSFDVVTLWDVLEHVEDPSLLLAQVARVVKTDGWVFAYTENFESFNLFMTGRFSEIVAPDVHLRHYSPQTFRREFEQAGFLVDRVYTMGLDWAHIRKTLATYPQEFPADLQLSLSSEEEDSLQDFINRMGKGDNLRLYARKVPG